MNPHKISQETILKEFRTYSFLDLRQIAARHGVAATNEHLCRTIDDLRHLGKICRIGGKGRRTLFVLATFEG